MDEPYSKTFILYTIAQRAYDIRVMKCPAGKQVIITALLNDGNHFHVYGFFYLDPDFINIKGLDESGQTVDILMHYSDCQLKFSLVDIESHQTPEKVKFGFETPMKDNNPSSE